MGPGGSTALWPPEGGPAVDRDDRSRTGTLVVRAPRHPHRCMAPGRRCLCRCRCRSAACRSLTSARRIHLSSIRDLNSSTLSRARPLGTSDSERNQAKRMISTGKLHMLPHFHFRPIDVVVFHDPSGKTHLGRSLALRCFQRLSRPNLATRPCP